MKNGWDFWVNDQGKVRMLRVAEPNEETALGIVLRAFPTVEPLSKQLLPGSVVSMLKLPAGRGEELILAEPKEAMRPGGFPL
jgi:hypothetical protein